jgi:hypothetical protein
MRGGGVEFGKGEGGQVNIDKNCFRVRFYGGVCRCSLFIPVQYRKFAEGARVLREDNVTGDSTTAVTYLSFYVIFHDTPNRLQYGRRFVLISVETPSILIKRFFNGFQQSPLPPPPKANVGLVVHRYTYVRAQIPLLTGCFRPCPISGD